MFPQSFAMFLYLRQQGYTGQLNNMIYEWCLNEGAPKGQLNEMINHALGLMGYTGALSERTAAFMTSLTTGMTVEQLVAKYSPLLVTDETGALQSTTELIKSNEGDPVGSLIDQSQGAKVVETLGPELVPNGNFATGDLTGFELEDPDADVQVVDNDAVITVTAEAPNRGFYWSFPTVAGQSYQAPVDVGLGDNTTVVIRVGNVPSGSSIGSFSIPGEQGSIVSFVADSPTTYITVRPNHTVVGDTATIKSVSTYSYDIEFEGLGPDLITNGDFSAGGDGWFVVNEDAAHIITFDGSTMRYQSDTRTPVLQIAQSGVMEVGRWYVVEVNVSNYVSGSLKVDTPFGGAVVAGNVGLNSALVYSPSPTLTILRNSPDVDITVSSISAREVLGNHLAAPSDAQRSTVAEGDMAFDGVDDALVVAAPAGGFPTGVEISCTVKSTDEQFILFNGEDGSKYMAASYVGGSNTSKGLNAGSPVYYVDGVEVGPTLGDFAAVLADGQWHHLNIRNADVSTWTEMSVSGFGGDWEFAGNFGTRIFIHDNNGPYGPLTDSDRAVITKWIKA